MGKFDTKEATRSQEKSTAKTMGGRRARVEKKLVSFQTPTEMYEKFNFINEQLGISNTAAINRFIADYVKEHSDLV